MSAAPPLARGDVISVWLDHPRLGCGERRLVVLRAGRKHVRLLHLPTLQAVSAPREEVLRGVRWVERADAARLKGYVPPWLKFATQADILAAVAAPAKRAAPVKAAKPAAPAKPAAKKKAAPKKRAKR